jgi:hypothetical protein
MPAWVAVYAAMFGATVAGQIGGMLLDTILGQRMLWVPALCSVVLEAIAGARLGRPAGFVASAKLSARYSAALVAVSLPLVVWVATEKSYDVGRVVLFALAAIAAATVLRTALLAALSFTFFRRAAA